jgi:hypothetical protein
VTPTGWVALIAVASVFVGAPLRRCLVALRRPRAAAAFAEGLSVRDEELLRTALPAPVVADEAQAVRDA